MFNSIRTQLMTLALLPAILIAIALGIYLGHTRMQDLDSFAHERGLATARQFANIARYTMTQKDTALLQQMASASLEESGLRSITVFDAQHQVLAHAGPNILPAHRALENFQTSLTKQDSDTVVAFFQPINNQTLLSDIQHSNSVAITSTAPLGWVAVEYNEEVFVLKRYEAYLTQNTILFTVILVAALFGYRLGQRLLSDLKQLNNGIKRLKENHTSTGIHISSSKELQQLADGIEEMASSLQSEFEEMRHNVELSTSDLQETIETIEVQNIELSLAQKSALEASRIKSEFLANTSHEIRTPLNCIIGFTKILRRSPLNNQQTEYLEAIQLSSEGLLTIINDILDFSKIEAGKLELEEAPFNLRQAFEEVISLFAPSAYDKNIETTLMIYQDVPMNLVGDVMRLKQIISNLLGNAIKFTDSGHIDIRVALESETQDDIQLSVAISDTGIGLSAQQQKEIFQAFAQANNSISREYGGTGLGLTISKKLIDLMHGDIHLESTAGQGSTFSFTVTIQTANQQEDNAELSPLNGKRIALYENHALLNSAIQHQLQHWGIQVHSCNDPITLQNMLSETEVDGVIYSVAPDSSINDSLNQAAILQRHEKKPVLALLPTKSDYPLELVSKSPLQICSKPATEPKLYRALMQLFDQQDGYSNRQLAVHTTEALDGYHILAVDDQEANLKLLQVLLSDLGITVTPAAHGKQAVELCQQQVFSLIFMDIQMPVMNGYDATEAIRKHASLNQQTPIVALTAHALSDEKQRLLALGANEYLTKPINEQQILATIKRLAKPLPTQNSAPNAIDIEQCLALANHKADLALDMLNLFTERLSSDMTAIDQAFTQNDLEQAKEQIHKLHGACCYTGVPALKQACKLLETALKKGESEQWPELQAELHHQADAVMNWLQHHNAEEEIAHFEASN